MKKLATLLIMFAMFAMTACGPKAAPEAATDDAVKAGAAEETKVDTAATADDTAAAADDTAAAADDTAAAADDAAAAAAAAADDAAAAADDAAAAE